jgi:primosomal protein N' (replication factor Y)
MAEATSTPAEIESGAMERVAVLLPLPFDEAYDYGVPPGLAVGPGSFVRVSFGPREVVGVVWGEGQGDIDAARLKDVQEVLETPPMTEPLRRLVEWAADYTLANKGSVLRLAMSVPAALEPPRLRTVYRLGSHTPARATAARARVLALLRDGPPRSAAELAAEAGVSGGVVRSLADLGALEAFAVPDAEVFDRPDGDWPGPTLSDTQGDVAEALSAPVADGTFTVTLLDGVTGSGKTEAYFEAVATALRAGKQVLVMLPEIALSAQWLSRFRIRFGCDPAVWHSELGARHRRETWRAVAQGNAAVVVGARSALWLPFRTLGLIVVDEEHDAAFKQEDGVIYHARDMAVVRARFENCPAVLVSATPSLETIVNTDAGRYSRQHLPDRHGGAQLPRIDAIDLRDAPPPRGQWLSPPLRNAIAETLAAKEQALLFLNRRGYAPLTLCRACGHRLECPSCSAWLVEHRFAGTLNCHHCDYRQALPTACPSCQTEASFVACGPGVERLVEEVDALFPDARWAILTSDTVHGPAQAQAVVEAIVAREIDLLVGTQMVAKGHHFPMLTLVGVVDADLGLAGGDLRAAERTYQMLHQVAGRAGRAERPGRVLLQTHAADHPVMAALVSGDRDAFMAQEAAAREAHGLPPFGRLAAVIATGPNEAETERIAGAFARRARADEAQTGIRVLGPAPAPMRLLRGRHRFRLLFKSPRGRLLQPHLRRWLADLQKPPRVRLQVDIDPQSFM